MNNRTRGIASYLFLAFGMAWILWEIPIQLGVSPRDPLFQLAALPGGFAPAIAAIIVRKWITHEGFEDAGWRLKLQKWPYYLVAWLLPLPVTAIIVALAVALGISQPDFSLQGALGALVLQLLITALVVTPILWGEEFGWRGYLQLRLLGQRPLLAAMTTGLIWGIWHYPLVLRGYQYPDHTTPGLFVLPVSTILLSIIFGWLRLRTGSIWPPSLAHAATNVLGASLTLVLFMGGPNWISVSYLGLLSWIPLGALCAWIAFTGQLKLEPAQDM
jgi:membrane protease YdiL (CAAX protease family)